MLVGENANPTKTLCQQTRKQSIFHIVFKAWKIDVSLSYCNLPKSVLLYGLSWSGQQKYHTDKEFLTLICFLCFAALASLGYEKTCVLFNAAALASQIASEQNLDNDEGLKSAAKYYQVGVLPHSYIVTRTAWFEKTWWKITVWNYNCNTVSQIYADTCQL